MIAAAVKTVRVTAAIIASAAIDAAAIGATSRKPGAVGVSAPAIADAIADAIAGAITEAIAAAISAIVTAAVVRRAVVAAVARVLTTGERDGEPRNEGAQKNPTPNDGSPLCLPERDLRTACDGELDWSAPPGRIARRPIDRLRPARLESAGRG
jgi:hypothetical protein